MNTTKKEKKGGYVFSGLRCPVCGSTDTYKEEYPTLLGVDQSKVNKEYEHICNDCHNTWLPGQDDTFY